MSLAEQLQRRTLRPAASTGAASSASTEVKKGSAAPASREADLFDAIKNFKFSEDKSKSRRMDTNSAKARSRSAGPAVGAQTADNMADQLSQALQLRKQYFRKSRLPIVVSQSINDIYSSFDVVFRPGERQKRQRERRMGTIVVLFCCFCLF